MAGIFTNANTPHAGLFIHFLRALFRQLFAKLRFREVLNL